MASHLAGPHLLFRNTASHYTLQYNLRLLSLVLSLITILDKAALEQHRTAMGRRGSGIKVRYFSSRRLLIWCLWGPVTINKGDEKTDASSSMHDSRRLCHIHSHLLSASDECSN